jgi:hypothetical protein
MRAAGKLAGDGVRDDHVLITADQARYCREHAIEFALDDDPTEYCPGATTTRLGIVSFGGR